jgi:hypothetical protein
MNRVPQRRSSAIQNEPRLEDGTARADTEEPGAERPGRISLGWRLAMVVWACGFLGLFGYELWMLLWKLGARMVGTQQ